QARAVLAGPQGIGRRRSDPLVAHALRFAQRLGEIVDRSGVVRAAVVPRDDVEVLEAAAVPARPRRRLELDERRTRLSRKILAERLHPGADQLGERIFGLQAAYIRAVGVSGDAGLARHLAPGLPAVLLEEVGDAADRVGRAAAEIAGAVVVEIEREAARAARHELRDAACPRVGAAHGEDVDDAVA